MISIVKVKILSFVELMDILHLTDHDNHNLSVAFQLSCMMYIFRFFMTILCHTLKTSSIGLRVRKEIGNEKCVSINFLTSKTHYKLHFLTYLFYLSIYLLCRLKKYTVSDIHKGTGSHTCSYTYLLLMLHLCLSPKDCIDLRGFLF